MGANRWEVRVAGRADGQVRAVAREFGVTERTVYRWAQQVRSQQVRSQQVRSQQVRSQQVRAQGVRAG